MTEIILREIQTSVFVIIFLAVSFLGFFACLINLKKDQQTLYGFNLMAHLLALGMAIHTLGFKENIFFALVLFLSLGSIALQAYFMKAERKAEKEEEQPDE